MKILLLLCITVSLYSNSYASNQYSLPEYIDYLQYEHTYFQEQQSKVKETKYFFHQSKGVQDWRMNHSIFSSHIEPYKTSSLTTSHINTFGTRFGFSRPILLTGGSLDFSITNQELRQQSVEFNGITFGEPAYFENEIAFSYTHPLLYGSNGDVIQYPILLPPQMLKQHLRSTEEYEAFFEMKS